MEIQIYADVLFALNFFMDLNILFITVLLGRIRLSILRISTAGFILALYGTAVFYPPIALGYSLPGRILISAGAVFLLEKHGRLIRFAKVYSLFWIVSMVAGGIIAALAMKTVIGNNLRAVLVNGTLYLDIPPMLLAAGILFSYLLMILFKKICTRNFSREKILVRLSIFLADQCICLTGLIDTGCELTVPGSGDGVILIPQRLLEHGIPEDAVYISVGTVNGENTIPVFYPDKIVCHDPAYAIDKNAAVGIISREFAEDGLYQAVMNPEVLRENNINGGRGHEEKMESVSGTAAGKDQKKMGKVFPRSGFLYWRK